MIMIKWLQYVYLMDLHQNCSDICQVILSNHLGFLWAQKICVRKACAKSFQSGLNWHNCKLAVNAIKVLFVLNYCVNDEIIKISGQVLSSRFALWTLFSSPSPIPGSQGAKYIVSNPSSYQNMSYYFLCQHLLACSINHSISCTET